MSQMTYKAQNHRIEVGSPWVRGAGSMKRTTRATTAPLVERLVHGGVRASMMSSIRRPLA
jgi:hypothetical protein